MPSCVNELAKLIRIPLMDIQYATNNFSNSYLIKKSVTGSKKAYVYEAKLLLFGKRTNVAVRRVLPEYLVSRDDFVEEIEALSGIKDKNIISILGFCDENGENIAVMEYADKKSLDLHLSNPALSWTQRLKICLGVTRGFQHMTNTSHYPGYTPTYEIRCSKILLDKDWEAKISVFGRVKNEVANQIGYSLGLIYLEVLYGRKGVIGEGGDLSLPALANYTFLMEKLDEFMYPTLRKQIHPLSSTIYLQTAYDCLTVDESLEVQLKSTANRINDSLEVQLRHEYIVGCEKGCDIIFPFR